MSPTLGNRAGWKSLKPHRRLEGHSSEIYCRIFARAKCLTPVSDVQGRRRKLRHFNRANCNVCGIRPPLVEGKERLTESVSPLAPEIKHSADTQRDQDTAKTILQGKIATGDFDVFLCHNSADKSDVRAIGDRLKERGILPWIDVEQLKPGVPWQRELERQIKKIKAAAVFVGKKGMGPWQDLEQEAFLRQFARRKCPVIPVILKDARKTPAVPLFLQGMTWVDFRTPDPDPLDQLVWGITGKRRM